MKRRYYVDPKEITAWWCPANFISCVSIPCFINFFAGISLEDGRLLIESIIIFLFMVFLAFLGYKFGVFDWFSKREYKKAYFREFGRYPEL